MIKSAIILAGGKGERLRPLTNDRPKPMVEVMGKPIIAYQIHQLKQIGVEEVVIACSYRREVIQEHMGDGKRYEIKALYSVEETPLGRGGGIKQAMTYLADGWKDVIVLNGDNLWKADLRGLEEQHRRTKAMVTMIVSPLKSPYGIIDFDKHRQVVAFREKPVLPYWLNSGIYILNKEIEALLPDVGDHETETFPKLTKERFFVFPSEEYWRGIDTVKDFTEAGREVCEIFKELF